MSDTEDSEDRPAAPSMPPYLSVASGLLMGGADAVPGVSGGTIALIIGIYDRFIDALSTMVRTPMLIVKPDGRRELRAALTLLVPLGIGVLISYYLATKLLIGPSDDPGVLLRPDTAPYCYAFLFGLVLVSLREPWMRIKKLNASHFVVAAIFAAGAAAFVGLPYRAAEPETWMLALGGAGAIAVMLLPGVSGSLLLVILGQYATVAGAIHDRDLTVIGVFGVGMIGGVIAFIPLLRYLLRTKHDLTMAALTGLMAGSLRALWPYKSNYVPKAGQMENVGIGDGLPLALGCLIAGGAVVWLLSKLEHRILEASSS